jgi:CheY-like chemotaxis protein
MATHFPRVPVELALQADVDVKPPIPLVYVVDDDPLIAVTLISILNGHGLAAIPVFNETEALELARLIPPDLLITDVAMPGTDGFALAIEVTKAAPDCDIIFISGEPSTLDLAAEYRAQGFDFVMLIKPVHPLDLLSCVFELLGHRGWLVPAGIQPRNTNPSDAIFLAPASLHARKGNGSSGVSRAAGPTSSPGPAFHRRETRG